MQKILGASLTSRRQIPVRGQVMVRIAATAYHSVVSVFSKLPRAAISPATGRTHRVRYGHK